MATIILGRSTSRSAAIGLVLGVLAIPVMFIVQPLLEPGYVWFEVALGLLAGFAVAEWVTIRQVQSGGGRASTIVTWRDYRMTLLWAYVGLGLPIVLYEIANHLILGRAV